MLIVMLDLQVNDDSIATIILFSHYYCNYSYHNLYISYNSFYYDNYNIRIEIAFDSHIYY